MRIAGILEPGFTSGVVTYAKYIQGSYIVLDNESKRDEILGGVLVNGTHVFIADSGKVQVWDGSTWIDEPALSVDGYLYNGELYKNQEHTERIQPVNNGLYFDKTKEEPIIYNGHQYVSFLSNYLKANATVAGLLFDDENGHPCISTEDLSNALDLKGLAHRNFGEVKINTIDSVTVNTTPSGTIVINDFIQTDTNASVEYDEYTPTGEISNGETTPRGNINVVLADSDEFSDASLTKTTYTPTIEITNETASVLSSVKSDGVLPTYISGTFTQGSISHETSNYNTDAMKMHMPSDSEITEEIDDETLIIEEASTANAISAVTYTPPTHGEDIFTSGSMPTFNTSDVVIDSSAVTKNPTDIITDVKYKKQVVNSQIFEGQTSTVTGMTFSGNSSENVIVKSVSYSKASPNGATFNGNTQTIQADVSSTQKTIDVEFYDQ